MADNPLSYLGGELAGYFVPGGAAWKGAGSLTKSLPGAQSAANAVGKMGRVPSYLGRMATSGAGFTADAALHGATVGASREEAVTGEKLNAGQRAGLAKEYALADVGDVADGFGVEVPGVVRGIPIAPALPVAGSIGERTIKGLGSGGKMITPDRVQASVLQNTGRAPSPNSTAAAMAEVLPAERITSGTVKTFRFIENALRNGLKDAGLPPADITRRVTRGFNRIHESLPALADGRTTLAQIVEREFADAGPQVSENLRLFLLRVGLDDPAVTRGVIDEMRTGQVDDFRQAVDENFGAQNTYTAETEIREGLNKLGQGFDQVLDKARQQSNNSPLSHSLREQLKQTDMKFELKADASKRGWKDVDTFIDQDPWQAGHVLQSKLAKLAENAAGSGSAAYSKFREPVVWIKEILNEVPGYKQMADTYAKEATVLDTLGHTKKVGSKEVTTPGFGPQLRKDARRGRDVARRADEFDQMPARQQDAARLSTGEVLKDQLRTARPGGTNLEGQDLLGLRLTDLQNEGMMSTNADMPGALPAVFGEAGERVSQKVDDIVNSRKFLADIDPKTGSNTVNKANAQIAGDSVVTSGLPRTMTSGYTQAGLIDATMFASGLPPVATMLTKGIPALGRVLGPGKKTRAEIAQALLQRPARQAPPPAPPGSIPPMSGRNRPRAWRNDDKWGDPNLSNPQIAGDTVPGGPTPSAAVAASRENRNFDRARLMMESDFIPADASPEGPLAYGTQMLKQTPQGKGRKATLDDWELQRTENSDTADAVFKQIYSGDRRHLWNDEPFEYLNEGGARIRIAQLRQQGLNTSDLEQQLRQRQYDYMREGTDAYNKIAEKEGFAPKPELFPGKDSERGMIRIGDGPPRRRRDVLRDAAQQGGGNFPVAQRAAPPPPPGGPVAPSGGIMEGPLPWLAGLGAAGTAGMAALGGKDTPEATIQPPPGAPVPDTFAPSLKPNLGPTQALAAQRASQDARTQDQSERQEYWNYLKSRGDGSAAEWNRINQERASELKVTPEDAARGVIRKRLPYVFGDTPVSVLSEAPIEELIDGQWRPAESARAIAQ